MGVLLKLLIGAVFMKEELLQLISEAIEKHPELRLGQLLENAAHFGGWKNTDIFYCPDEVLVTGLRIILSKENTEGYPRG